MVVRLVDYLERHPTLASALDAVPAPRWLERRLARSEERMRLDIQLRALGLPPVRWWETSRAVAARSGGVMSPQGYPMYRVDRRAKVVVAPPIIETRADRGLYARTFPDLFYRLPCTCLWVAPTIVGCPTHDPARCADIEALRAAAKRRQHEELALALAEEELDVDCLIGRLDDDTIAVAPLTPTPVSGRRDFARQYAPGCRVALVSYVILPSVPLGPLRDGLVLSRETK